MTCYKIYTDPGITYYITAILCTERKLHMLTSPALFRVPELLSSILEQCTVESRRRIAQTNKFHYDFVQDAYRRQIERELLTWFSRAELTPFWSCLDESEGVIGGSITLNAVVTVDAPSSLNIFVPKGKEILWECFLLSLGWGHFFSDSHFSNPRNKFTTHWWKHPSVVSFFHAPVLSSLTMLLVCSF